MSKTAISILLLLLLPSLGWSQLKLPAEVKGETGDFITVKAETEGAEVRWVAVDVGLKLFPVELLRDTRTAVVISQTAGRYRLLAYTCVDKKLSDPAITMVVVGTPPAPIPPPVPDPKPPIPPVPPSPKPLDEKLGFATLAKTEAEKLAPNFKALSLQLAGNFEAVAAKLAATSGMTIDAANVMLRDMNRETLPTAGFREGWLPWFTAWAEKADQLNRAGTLSTPAHYVQAYSETALGLRATR